MTVANYVLEIDFQNLGYFYPSQWPWYANSYEPGYPLIIHPGWPWGPAAAWGENSEDPTWENDITEDLLTVESRRGRDYASQLTGRATAGRLVATLKNTDGKYSSFNSSSPVTSYVVPGRKVRLRTFYPEPAILWTGYLDRIMPSAPLGGLLTATLDATGPMGKLAGKQVSPVAQASQTTGTIIGAILDAANWPAVDRDLDSGQTTVTRWYIDRLDAINAIREIEETELGWILEGLAFDLLFEDRHHRLKAPHTASQVTFSDTAGGGTLGYRNIEQQDPLREIFNEIIATVSPLNAVGGVSILWTLDEQPTIEAGASLVLWAEYPNYEVDPDIGAYVDAWTTPVATTDVTVSGVDIGDIAISAEKFAKTMKITLTNNGAATATVTLLQARGDPVQRKAPVRVTAEDTTSQTAYGERTYRLPGPWLPTTSEARDFVQYLLSRYKDPLPVLRMTIRANTDDDLMSEAMTRAISDRITVTANGSGTQLGINDDFFVEAITHRITEAGKLHDVVFELSDAEGDGGYWVLGVSTLGVTTKLAY